jgi:large subunit ribosomal protein L3
MRGHVAKATKEAFRVLREFETVGDGETDLAAGHAVRVTDVFQAGDIVAVTGISKGRGTAGVLKRHKFSGFPGSHGTHEYFRHGGAIGNRSYPGRVFKGKRMPGRMGNETVTVSNLEVLAVRPEEDVLLVRGAVPGSRGGTILIRKRAGAPAAAAAGAE